MKEVGVKTIIQPDYIVIYYQYYIINDQNYEDHHG